MTSLVLCSGHDVISAPGSARLGPARLGSARFDPAQPGSARLDSARSDSARLGSTQLGSVRLDSARLGSARLDSARPGSVLLDPARFCSVPPGPARLGWTFDGGRAESAVAGMVIRTIGPASREPPNLSGCSAGTCLPLATGRDREELSAEVARLERPYGAMRARLETDTPSV